MKKRKLQLVLLALVMVLALTACSGSSSPSSSPDSSAAPAQDATASSDGEDTSEPATAATGDPIRIGVVNPASGNLAVTGADDQAGCMIAIDMFNERGGVNGRMIEAVEADIPDAATAQTEITRLIQNENLTCITGCYGSSIVEVAASIADRNGVFWWENVSVLDRLTEQGYKSVFRVHVSGSEYGVKAAQIGRELAEKIGINKDELTIGIISENGDFGKSLALGIERYCEAEGISIVLNELYDATTSDTTPVVMQMKSADPDVVIATSYINDGINIVQNMKVQDYVPRLFLGIGSGYGAAAFPETLGADAEDWYDLDPTNAPVIENLDPEMQELVTEFQKRFEEKMGFAPTTVGYLGWQATWVLLNDVIAQVGDVDDVDALVAAAKALDIPEGTLPTGAGVKFGDNGQNQRCVIAAMQWTEGKLETVYPDFLAVREPTNLPMVNWSDK